MKAALYFRVSTDHQETASQRAQLLPWAAEKGWQIVDEYSEKKTGTTGDRDELQRMMSDAEAGSFDVVVFWSLDRLSREGPLKTMIYLERLSRAGVKFHSFSEPFLDSVSGVGELLIPILAWVAKQEAKHKGERVRAGIERAKKEGTRTGRGFGRPQRKIPRSVLLKMAQERSAGRSWSQLSESYRLPQTTIRRATGALPKTLLKANPQKPRKTEK